MRRWIALAVKIAVSAALLYAAFRSADLSEVNARLSNLDLSWATLAVGTLLIQIGLAALRWKWVAASVGFELVPSRALRYTAVAMFFNQTLPSTMGGDAVRVWFVGRDGIGWRNAVFSVLIDRFAGLVALLLIMAACAPWTASLVTDPAGRTALFAILGGASAGVVLFLLLGGRLGTPLGRWKLTTYLVELSQGARKMIAAPRVGSPIIGLSLVIHVLTVFAAWFLVRAIDAPVDATAVLLLVPPVLMVSMVPISIAGWGVREGAMVAAFTYAGLAPSDALVVSILLGLALLVVGMVGGAVWIVGWTRRAAWAADGPGGGK